MHGIAALGPLVISSSWMLFPHIATWLTLLTSFKSLLKYNLLNESFPATLKLTILSSPPTSDPRYPALLVLFVIAVVTICYTVPLAHLFVFLVCLPLLEWKPYKGKDLSLLLTSVSEAPRTVSAHSVNIYLLNEWKYLLSKILQYFLRLRDNVLGGLSSLSTFS